jgi:cysteinyl-tRNA synthetase
MKLFNTLGREIQDINPISDNKIKMYTCGITVYGQPHIGNWLAYIYSDVLVRVLLAAGYEVERTQNITDVGHLVSDEDDGEDKMQKGAQKEGLTAWQVADKYIKICQEESKKLGLLQPEHVIRATDLIPEQIEFVKELEAKGYTYHTEDGIYFDTSKLDDYGKLAKLDIKGLQAGNRVDIKDKRNATDFALWKFSPKDGTKRDMEWESPWGIGFPGWHLECSVIARESLGDQIDLHTGGIDHIPVHHTNEIAQTEALTGKKPFSRHWFHNNHIKVNGSKMSKSLGNIYTLSDIEQKGFGLDAFRLMVLSSHYQTEGNFTWEIMEAAQNRLNNWKSIADMRWQQASQEVQDQDCSFKDKFINVLVNENLDTPKALAIIDSTFDDIANFKVSSSCINEIIATIKSVLGIDLSRDDIDDDQKALLVQRAQARDDKDWARSDSIRQELLETGIKVRDDRPGQIWNWL